MIKRVILKNWKTHKNSSFEFGKGTNVLVGPMGSGKSSVMDAICFALFGTFPALNTRRVNIDEVIMAKPNEMDNAFVKVEFDYNGNEFAVERTIYRKNVNQAKFFKNSKIIAGPKMTDVTKAVENALDLNYNLFSRAVYSEQNQIDFFLRMNPSQRKEKFDELLDLEKYEKVRSNAVTVSNRLKALLKDKLDFLKRQEKEFDEAELKEIAEKIEKKEKEIKQLEKKLEENKKKFIEAEKEFSEMEKIEKEFFFLKELLVKSKTRVDDLEKLIAETSNELQGKKPEEVEVKLKKIEEEEKQLKKKIEKTEEQETLIQKKLDELNKFVGVNENKLLEVRERIESLKKVKANCPVCKTKLNAKKKKELVEEDKKLEAKLLKKMDEIESEKKKKKELSKGLVEEKERSLKRLNELNEKKLKFFELKKSFKKIEEKEVEKKDLEKEVEKIEKQLKEIHFDEEILKKKREELVELKAKNESLEKEIFNGKEFLKEVMERAEKVERIKKQILELKDETQNLKKVIEKLSFFTNSLKATQTELRTTLIQTINHAMHDIWQRLYPYQDYVSAKIEVEEGNYELMVKERSGKWVRVEGILSGGERSAAAICIRIAFSLVLTQNLSWLILDEPTHNLDAEAVKVLSSMLREHLPELVEQIFIITHDKEMEKAASSNLYMLNRDKNLDGTTKPVEATET